MFEELILFSGIAGFTLFLGGVLGYFFDENVKESSIKTEILHTLMAFGGGIIVSAVTLVLIPSGLEVLGLGAMALWFSLGALLFMLLDRYLARRGGQMATLLAMMMDFFPEAIALGALFAIDYNTALLLAVFIGMQNIPEAFNAYIDLKHGGISSKKILTAFFFLSFAGIIGALIGILFLSEMPETTASLMVFSGGGILYLIFQDIIPASAMKKKHYPSLGAALGFLFGIVGEMLI